MKLTGLWSSVVSHLLSLLRKEMGILIFLVDLTDMDHLGIFQSWLSAGVRGDSKAQCVGNFRIRECRLKTDVRDFFGQDGIRKSFHNPLCFFQGH